MSTLNDDALAELELLAQNQKKLNQLTQRMTGILSGFDRRLASLEGTLLPIHHRTQTLNRVEKSTLRGPRVDRSGAKITRPCAHSAFSNSV